MTNLKITKATVVLSNSADLVLLQTDLPCPFVPAFLPSQPKLHLSFETTYDTGVEYCRNYLEFEPEVINTRRNKEEYEVRDNDS